MAAADEKAPPTLYTAGHSTRTLEELVTLFREAGVMTMADVRRFPASRRHPWFHRDHLETGLPRAGIRYVWLGESLGGRRREIVPAERSPNRAWQVAAFRHYADALETPEVQDGVAKLETLARTTPTAVVCAERLWWQCHRRVLSDLMLVRGWTVVHLLEPGKSAPHRLTEWARIEGGRLSYPALV